MLAFIRWQDAPKAPGIRSEINTSITFGSATTLGVPTRLKDWIRGYPAMLPTLRFKDKQDKPQARRGSRTLRVVSVRRNVRMYSPDLVKTASSWATTARLSQDPGRGLTGSKEWERVAPSALKLQPRYSEGYKKRMDMPTNFHPYTGPAPGASSATSSTSSAMSASGDEKDKLGLGIREGEDRFRNLTELKWGEFEAMGFGTTTTADEKKLQFDLTESEKMVGSLARQIWHELTCLAALLSQTCDNELERLFCDWLQPHRCAPQRHTSVQYACCPFYICVADEEREYRQEAEENPTFPSSVWLGHRARHGIRRNSRGRLHGCLL